MIKPLTIITIPSFVRLRREIEQETNQLAVGRGERRETFWHVLARRLITRKRAAVFLYFADNMPVGYISVILAKFSKFRGNAYIAVVSVKKDYRGQGIGTKLLAQAEALARERRIRRLELEVFAKNSQAINLYKRLGYEVEGRRRQAVENEDGLDDVIFMAKFLQ